MILDAQLMFSDSQALTATAVGTNTIDLSVDRSIGSGEAMGVVFTVEVAADQTTGDEDYTFDVEYSSSEDQSSGYVLMGRRAFESGTPGAPAQNADLLVAGYKFVIPVPPAETADSAQYIGVRYTLAGTSPTITVSAHLVPLSAIDSASAVSYADGFAIT
jgi:hypothetical protein